MSSRTILLALFISAIVVQPGHTQAKKTKYQLTKFNNQFCTAKGRVQDCAGTVMQEILADGKEAIPVLISQLTETARTKYQIADYWFGTRSGDVAYVILSDLFTDGQTETFEMPGVPDWSAIMEGCDTAAQGCWNAYVRRHGRRSVQQAWLRAWNLHKDDIYWDTNARCFRVPKC